MRKRLFYLPIILFSIVLFSCAKEDPEPEDPSAPVTPVKSFDFRWTPSNGNTVVGDSAYVSTKLNLIRAFKNGNAQIVEIVLSDFSPDSYNISFTSGNKFDWVSSAGDQSATSGTVTITGNSNFKVTGNFAVAFPGGTGLTGNFTDVPMR